MRYLSDEWFAELAEAAAGVAAPAELELSVEQVIRGAGAAGEDVRYRLACRDGRCAIERGPGDADVSLVEDVATAVAIAAGRRTAGHAVLHGDVEVHGDAERLIAATPLLDLLAPAFAGVMARTELPAAAGG
jgi:hypothetical protein